MSSRTKLRKDIDLLNQISLTNSSGAFAPNYLTYDVSMENDQVAKSIKRQAAMNVETLDDKVRDLVDKFYAFSKIYRENHAERFLEDIKTIDALLSKSAKEYIDKIRWTDDETAVNALRKPVCFAYLLIFGNSDGTKMVAPDDFWRCLDLFDLRSSLYKSPEFKSIATMFVTEHGHNNVEHMRDLIMALKNSCIVLSDTYDKVISSLIKALSNGQVIPISDTIEFDKASTVVLGTTIEATISQAISKTWYGKNNTTNVGSMPTDIEVLLSDPKEQLTANNIDEVKATEYLFQYAKTKNAVDDLNELQREFVNVVSQVDLSSRRLCRYTDYLVDIPEQNRDGSYNYALKDVIMLINIYSNSLVNILTFTVEAATLLEDSYTTVNSLADKVKSLKSAIDTYIQSRE